MLHPTSRPIFQAFFSGNIPNQYHKNSDSARYTAEEDRKEQIATEICSQLGIRRTPSAKQEKKPEEPFKPKTDVQAVATVAAELPYRQTNPYGEGHSVVAYTTLDEKDDKPIYCVVSRQAVSSSRIRTADNGIRYMLSGDVKNANSTTGFAKRPIETIIVKDELYKIRDKSSDFKYTHRKKKRSL